MRAWKYGFQLRLPDALKDWVHQSAKVNRRSINGEIVFRLEAAMQAETASQPVSAGGPMVRVRLEA